MLPPTIDLERLFRPYTRISRHRHRHMRTRKIRLDLRAAKVILWLPRRLTFAGRSINGKLIRRSGRAPSPTISSSLTRRSNRRACRERVRSAGQRSTSISTTGRSYDSRSNDQRRFNDRLFQAWHARLRPTSFLNGVHLAIGRHKHVYLLRTVSSVYSNFVYHNWFQYIRCPCWSLQLSTARCTDDEIGHGHRRGCDWRCRTGQNHAGSNPCLRERRTASASSCGHVVLTGVARGGSIAETAVPPVLKSRGDRRSRDTWRPLSLSRLTEDLLPGRRVGHVAVVSVRRWTRMSRRGSLPEQIEVKSERYGCQRIRTFMLTIFAVVQISLNRFASHWLLLDMNAR